MSTTRRTVQVGGETYERLVDEAARHDEDVDGAAERILRDHLPAAGTRPDVRATLRELETLRARMKPGQGAARVVRAGREELEQRIA